MSALDPKRAAVMPWRHLGRHTSPSASSRSGPGRLRCRHSRATVWSYHLVAAVSLVAADANVGHRAVVGYIAAEAEVAGGVTAALITVPARIAGGAAVAAVARIDEALDTQPVAAALDVGDGGDTHRGGRDPLRITITLRRTVALRIVVTAILVLRLHHCGARAPGHRLPISYIVAVAEQLIDDLADGVLAIALVVPGIGLLRVHLRIALLRIAVGIGV